MVNESAEDAGTDHESTSFFAGVFGPTAYSDVDVPFNSVDWKGLQRREAELLSGDNIKMLETCEGKPIEYVLANEEEGRRYLHILQKLLMLSTAEQNISYYVVSKFKNILTESPERYSKLFLPHDEAPIDHSPLMRAITAGDVNVQNVASICLALLYITLNRGSDSTPLVSWACEKLRDGRGSSPEVKAAVSAMTVLLRNEAARAIFVRHGGIPHLNKILRMQGGDSANAQLLYSICFCLWSLSLSEDGAYNSDFASCGAVSTLVEQVSASPTEKVVRVALATLRNLSRGTINSFNEEMIACGLPRTLDNMKTRKWGDPDIITDIDELSSSLQRNFRDLTTMEAYTQEVRSGRLRWGVVHTERFWRENARATESDDFFLIRALIDLLRSEDNEVVAIACYDLGEFVRFYPTGKAILRHLNAKPIIMELVEHSDPEIRKQALLCISKIMVNKWEFLR